MDLKKYEDKNSIGVDVLKEIGSIGTGNAATALSTVLGRKIEMSIPEVEVIGFNQALKKLGGPEQVVAAVLVQVSGEINGVMLFMQDLQFINIVLESLLNKTISDYDEIDQLEISALTEVGNILISSYMNALSTLAGITMDLSVPSVSINMLGGIMNVPFVMYGYQMDKLMTIRGRFRCDGEEMFSRLLLLPDMESLDYMMKKLGVNVE